MSYAVRRISTYVVLTGCSDSLGQPGLQVDILGFPCVTSELSDDWSASEINISLSQFVLALGNRPKGERTAYAVTLWSVVCCKYPLLRSSFIGSTPFWLFTYLYVHFG